MMKNLFLFLTIMIVSLIAFGQENNKTVTDIDGNVYKIVTIGNQVWMAENLKTTRYRNGDLIGTTSPANVNVSTEISPKYQWAYEGNESNVTTYGRLYTWHAANDSRNVCPTGWHLPTDAEWTTLITYLGGKRGKVGGKLKETGTTHFKSPNIDATNVTGFTALPGGYRRYDGSFTNIGYYGYWWSSTEYGTDFAWHQYMGGGYSDVSRQVINKPFGFSVRCLRDN